jgi:hypothetical protein
MKDLRSTLACALVAGLAAVMPLPGNATAVAGPGGTADQGRRIVHATPAAPDAPALELISAVIDAVQPERGQIVVRGKPVPLHPTRLKVLYNGQSASASALAAGQSVRFALDADAAGPRRIVLIHIDR